jgi:hypothetical protein
MRNIVGIGIVAVFGFLLSSCATTNMESIQPAPNFHSARIRRVLVIGSFNDQALRKTFEEEFVRQWRTRHVEAVSSLDVLPPSTPLDKAGVAPFAKARGFDAVLVTQLLARRTVAPGETASAYADATTSSDLDHMDSALQVLFAPPTLTSSYNLVAVQTNLYDVDAGKRVWSATSETEVIGKVPKLIRSFVNLILKRLYETP